ncbi:MAG: NAD(P)-dependent glycerol-3-phosphate dehydrogenase [Candidatus Rokubacteria bacterium]|nr:NAD(P)-dependent glycerol-3-phosphate dehydrogenase [Candidatus Rokubacteria bacterium]
MTPAPVAVIGGGSWGTGLSVHLGRLGLTARLWARDAALVALMRSKRENPWYLPGIPLPAALSVTSDHGEALEGAGLVIVAVPSHVFDAVLEQAARRLARGTTILSATKGLEPERARRMSEIASARCPGSPIAALSGPTFAREVALGRPTAAVVASTDPDVAKALQRLLSSPEFRLYTNRDLLGVEIGGALKNVMAIATGISDGLGLGENARAALITRGLAEITRLGGALGASPATFAGLAGIGDLVLTCTGSLSRNHALGLALARGQSLEQARGETRMVAEGARTSLSATALARRVGVALPICQEVAAVLFEGKTPKEALASLLQREYRAEEEPLPATSAPGGRRNS